MTVLCTAQVGINSIDFSLGGDQLIPAMNRVKLNTFTLILT